ncbi:2TM domain-containing protein [Hymenobacter negativus]|uniref:2TM domain-containing protein n=1 Tax=Hymenobacter negativus TaxID=2795026 RepID=A0ABS3QG74_9BACT|nr:2TM domain-containing protein [Hymenobacter negativus]MBO2009789.1 2TM domain-containing protein [Hymenobacter negativus]
MESLQRDPYLWQKAKARAKFQSHLVTYMVINAMLWVIWALTDGQFHGGLPWPIWTTAFWGFGLVMNGIAAYGNTSGMSREQRTQREYEQLMREQARRADPLDKYR